uniref:Uncharacterized protein n=1 Tax=Arundo donax TaxID=35708 RepID=A0A0A9F8A6_ARUDO
MKKGQTGELQTATKLSSRIQFLLLNFQISNLQIW